MGGNPLDVLLNLSQQGARPRTTQMQRQPVAGDEMIRFVSVVLADTEEVWEKLFREQGWFYRKPTLIL